MDLVCQNLGICRASIIFQIFCQVNRSLYYLVRCHGKEWTDKKGKRIQSNWKSLRTQAEIDEDRNQPMIEPIRENNPLEEKIMTNWTEIRAKYEETCTIHLI